MPSASEIMTLQSIAERHGPGILDIVLKQLNGIVHQGVWRNSMGDLVYTKDIDIDNIYHTVLDIFMGDYALFCMETSEDGADIALSNDFDRQAIAAVAKIRQLLPIYRVEHREWCDTNPVARIETPAVQERTIEPLSQEAVARLNATAQGRRFRDMRFSLSLLLYSGVRPAEVERLNAEDVCWEERQVIIRPQKSKTGGGRVVPLRLLPGLRRQDCHVPRNWQNRWLALRRAAGFTHWVPDVCRHTFASYHAAHFRNLPELQLEMGHRDLSLLRSRYMMPTSRRTAALFWRMLK